MARDFPGTASNGFTVPNAATLTMAPALNSALSAWIRDENGNGTIIAKWNGIQGGATQFIFDTQGQKLRFIMTRDFDANNWTAQSSGSIPLNQWTHVFMQFTPADETARLYINGGADGSFDLNSSSMIASTQGIGIGLRWPGDPNSPFNGQIKDVAWWNAIISTDERTALATGRARPSRIRPQSLRGYWPLEGHGSTEPDYSGNGNIATVAGTVNQAADLNPALGPAIWTPGGGE